ncbi:MAG: hypothetical protein M1296_02785 [Chloroflexi bacterium]|nr:hypothetical protein [Chloroflexota bacterium]
MVFRHHKPEDGEHQESLVTQPFHPLVNQPEYGTDFSDQPEAQWPASSPRQLSLSPAQVRAIRFMRLCDVISWITALIEVIIALRFVLELIGANASAAFSAIIYAISTPIISPFVGVVPSLSFGVQRLELPDALAAAVYALGSALLIRLIHILFIDQPRLP